MSAASKRITVTGIGTIPEGTGLVGSTFTTDPTLDTKINVSGTQVKFKSLYEGDSFFASNEMRKVKGFYDDGSILVDSAFSAPLAAVTGERVPNGRFTEISYINDDLAITGTIDGSDVLPKNGDTIRSLKGIDAMIYNTNSGNFIISTTTF